MASSPSPIDDLERLEGLRNRGAITEKDYDVLKAAVIQKIQDNSKAKSPKKRKERPSEKSSKDKPSKKQKKESDKTKSKKSPKKKGDDKKKGDKKKTEEKKKKPAPSGKGSYKRFTIQEKIRVLDLIEQAQKDGDKNPVKTVAEKESLVESTVTKWKAKEAKIRAVPEKDQGKTFISYKKEEKLEVIKKIEKQKLRGDKKSVKAVAEKRGIPEATVKSWWKKRDEIRGITTPQKTRYQTFTKEQKIEALDYVKEAFTRGDPNPVTYVATKYTQFPRPNISYWIKTEALIRGIPDNDTTLLKNVLGHSHLGSSQTGSQDTQMTDSQQLQNPDVVQMSQEEDHLINTQNLNLEPGAIDVHMKEEPEQAPIETKLEEQQLKIKQEYDNVFEEFMDYNDEIVLRPD